MTSFPRTFDDVIAATGEIRAGGTDVQARRLGGISRGPLVDLQKLPGLDRIEASEHGPTWIGAMVRIAALADDKQIQARYPGLAAAAADTATPQIRSVATVGGNLLQKTRCSYYRHPATSCYKKGGDSCPARDGNHLFGVCLDLGPCIAPHPSTLGMALLAYDAQVEVHGRAPISVSALYGDGSNPYADHQLATGELLTGVLLPQPLPGERAVYLRTSSRALAEWPLIEVLIRVVAQERISFAGVAVGGVANIPLRLKQLEENLIDQPACAATLERAVDAAVATIDPLPVTEYKARLLRECLVEALEQTIS